MIAATEAVGARRATHRDEVKTRRVLLTAHGTADRVRLPMVDDGLEVQLTGPWPPYHFVELRLADEGGSA